MTIRSRSSPARSRLERNLRQIHPQDGLHATLAAKDAATGSKCRVDEPSTSQDEARNSALLQSEAW